MGGEVTFLQTCIAGTHPPAEARGRRPQATLPRPSQPAVPSFPVIFYDWDLLGIAAEGRTEEQGSTQTLPEDSFMRTHGCVTGFAKTRLLWVFVTVQIQSTHRYRLLLCLSRTDRVLLRHYTEREGNQRHMKIHTPLQKLLF